MIYRLNVPIHIKVNVKTKYNLWREQHFDPPMYILYCQHYPFSQNATTKMFFSHICYTSYDQSLIIIIRAEHDLPGLLILMILMIHHFLLTKAQFCPKAMVQCNPFTVLVFTTNNKKFKTSFTTRCKLFSGLF